MAFNQYWLCNYSSNICTNGKCQILCLQHFLSSGRFCPSNDCVLFLSFGVVFHTDWPSNLKSIWDCNWTANLNQKLIDEILVQNFSNLDLTTHDRDQLLWLAVSALQAFVQENFVGPPLHDVMNDEFNELSWHSTVKAVGSEAIRNYLLSDGEAINPNVNYPELLAIAKYCLSYLNCDWEQRTDAIERVVCKHWLLRCLGVHQLCLDENTDTLFKEIDRLSNDLTADLNACGDSIDVNTKVSCLLEITAWQLHYKRVGNAKEKLQMAQQMLDVNITIEGKMGVRTKYQQKPVPQLMLRVDSPNGDIVDIPPIESPVGPVKLPMLLQLDDDVRLDKIQFVNEEDNVITRTKSIVQALILGT